MRKAALSLAIFVLFVAPMLRAGTMAGVTMPDEVQVGSKKLVLNGLGIRKKFVVKVYVAGLYLEKKSSDSEGIIKSDSTKRIVMHFVHTATKNQMVDAFDDSFRSNTPEAHKNMKADIDRLFAALEAVKEGDEMVFTYVPGTGTTMAINGKDKLTIANPAFAPVIFSVWLGPKPPNSDLKRGMCGQ